MSTISVIDLFSGCGGLSFGFELAKASVVAGFDINKNAIKSFEHNHINSTGSICDLEKISKKDIVDIAGTSEIDVIVGGPPCQGFSLSGPRNYDDPRNRLYKSFLRIASEIKPSAIVIENVPGLATLFKGSVRNQIVHDFSNLGYEIHSKILCAADYGVPQMRNRLFFVGIGEGGKQFSFPKPTHFSAPTLFGDQKYVTCSEAINDLPALEDDVGEDPCEYSSPAVNEYQKLIRKGSDSIRNHIAARHTDHVRKIISMVPDGGNYKSLPVEYRNTRNFHVAWTRFNSKLPAPTIDTGHRHHFHYQYNRVPTVRECARLQSFPDRFIFIGNKSEQFSQVGNAVPPLLAKSVGERVLKCL